jgi:outer membrane protein assembly factor BamB
MRLPAAFSLPILAVLLVATARAEDWPAWRGPTGQGLSDAKDLPLAWGKDGENILWKSPLPGGEGKTKLDHNQSSPIVWRDRVFLTNVFWPEGTTAKEMPEHHVACYQTTDGKQLWDVKVPPGPWLLTDLRGGYCAPTPATDGERVYVLFGSAVLAALDFDGKIVWRTVIKPHAFDVAIGTSPVLSGDKVLVLCDQADKNLSRLAAFDKTTGELKWEQKRPTARFSHSTPLLTDVGGKPQLLVASSDAVQGLDPTDGKLLWWCANPGDVATPVYGGGLVFALSGRGGPGVAVDPTGAGDVAKTHLKWKTGPVSEDYGSPVIAAGYVYFLHRGNFLKCWKLDDGALTYNERLPEKVVTAASPVATADGRLYFASGGKSLVVQPGPEFKILGTSDLLDPANASPAVADGKLFIKGGKNLYCVGKKAP